MLQLLLIALGLAMDAFSVSVVSGICLPDLKRWQSIRAALFFGFFQFCMPLLGCLIGSLFSAYINDYDHWIAFILLAVIGGKMAIEALRELLSKRGQDSCACDDEEKRTGRGIQSLVSLTVLAFATSIDALAVGLSMSLLGQNMLLNASVIGIVTFCLSLAGVRFGRKIGSRLGEWAEIVGGLVLLGIGVKILVEHLSR